VAKPSCTPTQTQIIRLGITETNEISAAATVTAQYPLNYSMLHQTTKWTRVIVRPNRGDARETLYREQRAANNLASETSDLVRTHCTQTAGGFVLAGDSREIDYIGTHRVLTGELLSILPIGGAFGATLSGELSSDGTNGTFTSDV
jgi:hypothetical protein